MGGNNGNSTFFDQLLVFSLAYSADSSFVVPSPPKRLRRLELRRMEATASAAKAGRLNQNLPADLSGVAHLSADLSGVAQAKSEALAKAEAESEDLSKAGLPACPLVAKRRPQNVVIWGPKNRSAAVE
jgi:hypothetical protein